MRQNIKDLLSEINSKIEETDECEWDIIKEIFADAIKRKGLSKEEAEEINERVLKEFESNKKIRYGVAEK